jgi:hypothetical protein
VPQEGAVSVFTLTSHTTRQARPYQPLNAARCCKIRIEARFKTR